MSRCEEKAKRRWWQFSLRSLLMLSLLIGAFLAGRLSVWKEYNRKETELLRILKVAEEIQNGIHEMRKNDFEKFKERLKKDGDEPNE